MFDIRDYAEELIYEFVTKTKPKIKLDCPNDILEKLTYDAIEDIKEQIWETMKYELDYDKIYSEVKQYNRDHGIDTDEEDEDEEEDYDDSESDLDEKELKTDDESEEE